MFNCVALEQPQCCAPSKSHFRRGDLPNGTRGLDDRDEDWHEIVR